MAIYNVMNAPYNAQNNNATDDAAAINAAIAAANAAGGGVVYLPGNPSLSPPNAHGYQVNSPLTVLGKGVTLEGDGWNASIIRANFANGDTLTLGQGATGGGEMNTVRWIGFDPKVTRASGAEVRIIGGHSVYIHEVKVMNVSGVPFYGFWFDGSNGYKQYMYGCEANGCAIGSVFGRPGTNLGSPNLWVTDSEFSACIGPGTAIYGGGPTFSHTEWLNNNGPGILLSPVAGGGAGIALFDCLSDTNNGDGLECAGSGGRIGIKIRDSWFSNNGNILNATFTRDSVGVRMNNLVNHYDIQGTHFVFNGGDGVALFSTGLGEFYNNLCMCNGQFATTTGYSGCYVMPNGFRPQIWNNYFDPGDLFSGNYPAKQAWGLYVDANQFLFTCQGNASFGHTGGNYNFGTVPVAPVANYNNF